jgi:pyruvate dehydrogenase E2 component (dihydrolipoamide acetyltransferase)
VLVKPGDVVKVDQSLVTLESDKAAMDVPSPIAGAIAEVVAKVGDKVSMGTLLARIDSAVGEAATPAAPAKASAPLPAKGPAAAEPAKAATIDVAIPDIGDFKDVPIIEILVKEGETVAADQPLVTLESDKASMDVPSPAAGKITQIVAKVGDKVSMGTVIAKLEAGGAAPSAPAKQADKAEAKEEEDAANAPLTPPAAPKDLPPAPAGPAKADFSGVFAGPAVRRLARELGLDLNRVKGTGEKGRITREDVKAALVAESGGAGAAAVGGAGALPAIQAVDFAKFGPVETVPLSRIKRISGPRLHASWVNVPHVTHCDEADITDLDAFRKTLDEEAKKDKSKPYRVSLLPLLMRAVVATLKAFNAALSPAGDALIMRRYWAIGVAVDTPDGLVVAVIKDVDKKGVIELARELGALSEKARAGKLAPAEMQGATFTISSLGGIGGTAFSPIVNAPEVAILGVVRSKMAPVWDGSAFQPRLMLPLCLSYDHRVIDGAAGARFMRHLAAVVEDMRRVIL